MKVDRTVLKRCRHVDRIEEERVSEGKYQSEVEVEGDRGGLHLAGWIGSEGLQRVVDETA